MACVLCFVVVLVFVVSVGGVLWVGYVAVGNLVTACRDAVAAFVGPLKGKIVVFAAETGKALRGIGAQLREICKGLFDWVREV